MPERLLTAAELELMHVLWRAPSPLTVQEVVDGLADHRAYTTVATLLKILEDKGFLVTEREGRRLRYAPAEGRAAYEATAVSDVVTRVFDGSASALVRALVGTDRLSTQERAEILALLQRSAR